jgi:hypothetical protein
MSDPGELLDGSAADFGVSGDAMRWRCDLAVDPRTPAQVAGRDRLLSPGECCCPMNADTGQVGRAPSCPQHGYTDLTPATGSGP